MSANESEISKLKNEVASLWSEVNLLKNKTRECCYCEKKGRQKIDKRKTIKGMQSIIAEKGIKLVHHMPITNLQF